MTWLAELRAHCTAQSCYDATSAAAAAAAAAVAAAVDVTTGDYFNAANVTNERIAFIIIENLYSPKIHNR